MTKFISAREREWSSRAGEMVNEAARVRTPGAQRRKRNPGVGGTAPPEVRDPVEVMCRVRPLPQGQEDTCIAVLNEQTLRLTPPEQSRAYLNR